MIQRWALLLCLWMPVASAATITITIPDQRLKDEIERACTSRLPCGPGTPEERLTKFVNILIHVGSSFYGASYKTLDDLDAQLNILWETP